MSASAVVEAQATPHAPPRTPSRWARVVRRSAARLLAGTGVLFGAATVVFWVQTLLPGDRATLILNIRTGQAVERTPAELAPINAQYGFEQPLLVQYWQYLAGLVRGDLGISYQLHRPVVDVIGDQIGSTVQVALGALVVAWALALVGVLATAGRRRRISSAASSLEAFAASMPHYWLGALLLVVFAINLQWLPVMGGTDLRSTVLPVVTLAIPLAGFLGQVTRDEVERVLGEPFVITARARGMSDLGVRVRHVLRHAVIPAITLSGWALGALLSGAVIVEAVFSRPGIGQVLVRATESRDLPVVAGVVVIVAGLYVLANVLVDAAYTLVDPRRRAE